jgi:hypothetical protein
MKQKTKNSLIQKKNDQIMTQNVYLQIILFLRNPHLAFCLSYKINF